MPFVRKGKAPQKQPAGGKRKNGRKRNFLCAAGCPTGRRAFKKSPPVLGWAAAKKNNQKLWLTPVAACRPCAAMRASRRPCALRPRSRRASAGALSAHVRFCGARSARLTVSKVSALALDCAENTLDIRSVWPFPRMVQSWNTMQKCGPILPLATFVECHMQMR